MTLITAMELANNYPENILIEAKEGDDGKFASFCYLMQNKVIHKLMLNTGYEFLTGDESVSAMHRVASACVDRFCS